MGVDLTPTRARRRTTESSPHAWGWTDHIALRQDTGPRRPHTRGGGPKNIAGMMQISSVVPTRVGVDRSTSPRSSRLSRVVPTRVGVDRRSSTSTTSAARSSPHAWGWTGRVVDPARRGLRRPHARGGGPTHRSLCESASKSSLRTWGWTGHRPRRLRDGRVVPTHVGVNRRSTRSRGPRRHRPHAGGGGPKIATMLPVSEESSPRTWGWTAGVRWRRREPDRRPHTRGGGPFLDGSQKWDALVVPTRVGVDRSTTSPTRPS